MVLGTIGRPVLSADIRQRNKVLKPEQIFLYNGWILFSLPDHLHSRLLEIWKKFFEGTDVLLNLQKALFNMVHCGLLSWPG